MDSKQIAPQAFSDLRTCAWNRTALRNRRAIPYLRNHASQQSPLPSSRLASRPPGALSGAVNLAAIATTAADRHLDTVARTKEQSRRDGVVLISSTGPRMMAAAKAAIPPRHAWPGTVWRMGAEAKPGSWARHRACRRWCGPGALGTSHLNPDRCRYPTLAVTAGA